MGNFYTRPNFEDRQHVQYSGTSITLSGETYVNNTGFLQINAPILDFTGTTTASTVYTVAGVQGYINYGSPSSFIVQPPIILQSGSTGTTTVDVTGYFLGGLDSTGKVTWIQAPPSGSSSSTVFSGGSGNCITDLYVTNIHGCSPINIQPLSADDVYLVYGGGNVGIGMNSPTVKVHISGNTRIQRDFDGDTSVTVNNTNVGGTSARGVIATSAIVTAGGRVLNGIFTTSGYNTDLSGSNFGDNGTGYLKSALTITVAGNSPRGDINIGTRDSGKFLRFFSGSDNFDSSTLRGSLTSGGFWGFGTNVTAQTATVQVGDEVNSGTFRYVDGNQQSGYVMTSDASGNATWQVSSGGGSFTGNTSASCITDLYITNLHGCSPITVWDSVQSKGSSADSVLSFALGSGNTVTDYCDNSAIIGGFNNRITYGFGITNTSKNSAIVGGMNNTISGHSYSFIGGGYNNLIDFSGYGIAIVGGVRNRVEATIGGNGSSYSSVVGGMNNFIRNSTYSSVNNGTDNIITNSTNTSIIGGSGNTIHNGIRGTIIGGYDNAISATTAEDGFSAKNTVILGGRNNNILQGDDCTIIGGRDNRLTPFLIPSSTGTQNSMIAGRNNSITGKTHYSGILGGFNNTINKSSGTNILGGFGNYVKNGTSNIVGGGYNSIIPNNGSYNTVFGYNNLISGGLTSKSSIIGGGNNGIPNGGDSSVIIGGDNNILDNTTNSVILGGQNITGTTSDTAYVPDLVIKKSASVPTSSLDAVGENGSVTWDNNYFYWKANNQWLRISGQTF